MGKMKELYMAMKEGYIEDLRQAYINAEQNNLSTVWWQGREVSTTYAKYILEFQDTFLKGLTDDNISNANDESERLL